VKHGKSQLFLPLLAARRSKPLYIAIEYMKLDSPNALPAHIEDAVSDIAKVHLEHRRSAGRLQRLVDAITAMLGRPVSIAIIAFLIAGWIIFNCFAESVGFRALDPPPFQFLSVAVSMTALFMAAMILTTQRRETELADRREQLTLELAILSDRRTAKLIQLVENIRRDHPELSDAVDEEALAMSSHTNVQDVLNALKKSYDPNAQ
jgi:uncharacterized membrane protein